jgi:hypothetical protein
VLTASALELGEAWEWTVGESILHLPLLQPRQMPVKMSYRELLLNLPLYNSCCETMFFDASEGHGIVGIAYDQQQP